MHLRRLALGFLRAIFDLEVDRGVRLRFLVDLHLAGVVGSVDGRLDLLALERPLGVDAVTVGGPGSMERLEKLGLRLVVAKSLGRGSRHESETNQSDSREQCGEARERAHPRTFRQRHDGDSSKTSELLRPGSGFRCTEEARSMNTSSD